MNLPPEALHIGDTVYQTDGERIYASTIHSIDEIGAVKVYNTESISFDWRAIGEDVFLSKEEAERRMQKWE